MPRAPRSSVSAHLTPSSKPAPSLRRRPRPHRRRFPKRLMHPRFPWRLPPGQRLPYRLRYHPNRSGHSPRLRHPGFDHGIDAATDSVVLAIVAQADRIDHRRRHRIGSSTRNTDFQRSHAASIRPGGSGAHKPIPPVVLCGAGASVAVVLLATGGYSGPTPCGDPHQPLPRGPAPRRLSAAISRDINADLGPDPEIERSTRRNPRTAVKAVATLHDLIVASPVSSGSLPVLTAPFDRPGSAH